MAKKRAKRKPVPKPKVKPKSTIAEPIIEIDIEPADGTSVIPAKVVIEAPLIVAPPKPTTGQCANCGRIGLSESMFKCQHCGKTGCPPCGWDKTKFQVCPNCATPVQ